MRSRGGGGRVGEDFAFGVGGRLGVGAVPEGLDAEEELCTEVVVVS